MALLGIGVLLTEEISLYDFEEKNLIYSNYGLRMGSIMKGNVPSNGDTLVEIKCQTSFSGDFAQRVLTDI